MTEQQVNGAVDQAIGRLQNAAGALASDLKTQAGGKVRELRGLAESRYGDAAATAAELAGKRPLSVLGAALGVGVIIGLFLARN